MTNSNIPTKSIPARFGLQTPNSTDDESLTAEHCYQNLLKYRSSRTDTNDKSSDAAKVFGKGIARLFGEETKNSLSEKEFEDLQHFLSKSPSTHDPEYLRKQIFAKLRTFYAAEVLESGGPLDRLAAPSGPEDAELGLVMHCQSKEGEIGRFWDTESRTIQTLAEKGLSDMFIYGFDWHWRGETSARGRGPCPTAQWTKTQGRLHDAFSCDVLETLPLPLLIVAGSCPKKQYRKTLSSRAKSIELATTPSSIIRFDFDFRSDGLRRIIAYIDHPSASFFHPDSSAQRSVCQDATLTFFLWLAGKNCRPMTFTKIQGEHRRGVPGSAPLKELWQYVKMEEDLHRRLERQEYERAFWTWAHTFLKEESAAVLERGNSVAATIRDEIHSRIRITKLEPKRLTKRAHQNRQLNASRYGFVIKEYWDGEAVRVHKNGDIRIFVSAERPALMLRVGKAFFRKVEAYGNFTIIQFSEMGFMLKIGEHVVYEKSRKSLQGLKHGLKWVEQLDKEVTYKRLKSSPSVLSEKHPDG